MINSLQLIVYCYLFRIAFPANAAIFYKMLLTIACFDVVDSEQVLYFFNFSESDPYNSKFEEIDIFSKILRFFLALLAFFTKVFP